MTLGYLTNRLTKNVENFIHCSHVWPLRHIVLAVRFGCPLLLVSFHIVGELIQQYEGLIPLIDQSFRLTHLMIGQGRLLGLEGESADWCFLFGTLLCDELIG